MNVQELFERLSYGELSNLEIGMDGAGAIAAESQMKIVSQINTALTALYSRFLQRRAFLELEMQEGMSTYVISSEFALSNTEPTRTAPAYILDSAEAPFRDDLIKILSVSRRDDPATAGIDEARGLPINHRDTVTGRSIGITIMAHDTIHVRDPQPGQRLLVEYQANHPRLSVPAVMTETISIMPALEEALQLRVASGVFSGMGGEAHSIKGAELLARYEQLCQLAKLDDMAQESSSDIRDRLRDKGFV